MRSVTVEKAAGAVERKQTLVMEELQDLIGAPLLLHQRRIIVQTQLPE